MRLVPVLRVGGVDAAGSGGQSERAAVGAEDRDLPVLGEVGTECGPEGVGVRGGLLPFKEPGEPAGPGRVGALSVRGFGGLRRGAAVRRVRITEGDDARLGDLVHSVRTDENFGDRPVGANDRGVQGLVQVEFGGGDEVLELGDHRGETGVQFTEHGIAVGVLADENQQCGRGRCRAVRRV